LSNRIKPRS